MPQTVLLVGTRKGCFVLESDGDRRDWERARPVLRGLADLPRGLRRRTRARSTPPRRASGTAPASGAAPTSARRGSSRARASPTATRASRKLSKVSGLTAAHGRLLAGAEAAGHLREPRRRRDLVAAQHARRPAGPRRLERPGEPAARPPRPAGDPPAPRRRRRASGRSCRASASSRRPTTARRGRRATAGCAPTGRASTTRSASACTSSCMSPADHDRLYQQNHVRHAPQRRRRALVDRDHRGAAVRLRLRRRRAPARPRQLLRDPARPGPRPRACPTGKRRRLAHARRGLDAGSGSTAGCRSATRTSACCARGWRSTRSTRPASTSARAPARCSRAPTRARAGARSRATCPAIASVEVAVARRSRGRPAPARRRCRRSSPTCRAGSRSTPRPSTRRSSGSTSAGPACATGSASPGPALRPHIHVYVDGERAELDTALGARSRVDVIAAISGG